MRCS
ncbi:hypothetical protein S40285_09770, partial [Stachybotrys chlorohalonatus IBT 40285]|jgi:hypothetical protein